MAASEKHVPAGGSRASRWLRGASTFALFVTSLPAAELYRQYFEGDPAKLLTDHFLATENAGNRWKPSPRSGTGGGTSLSAPPGQTMAAIAKTPFPGFATHPVISVTLDSTLSARWNGGAPFMLPFAVRLVADPKDPASAVAGFYINYEPETFGEDTQLNVGAEREGSFIWHPASTLENYEPNARDSSVAAWFRWTAVFTYDAAANTIQTTLSVAAIGIDGTDPPKPIQKWEFEPVNTKPAPLPAELHFAVEGRARDGFGVLHIDNVTIAAGVPAP